MKVSKKYAGIIIFFLILCSLFISCGKARALKIAFCGVPQKYETAIIEEISDGLGGTEDSKKQFTVDVTELTEEQVLAGAGKICKKYDLIFTENGRVSQVAAAFGKKIPADLVTLEPESIGKRESNVLPLFINHYGIAYSKSVKKAAGVGYPANFDQFEQFLAYVQKATDVPLFVPGGDDVYLLAFTGAVVESFTGSEGYKRFIDGLKNYTDFEALLSIELNKNYTTGDIFEVLAELQKNGCLPQSWIINTKNDFKNYAAGSKPGAAFLALSDFRSQKYSIASDFACDRFPVKTENIAHGLMAPEYVVINCSGKKKSAAFAQQVTALLVSDGVQKKLSEKTQLAPATASARSYDQQADDVRFLAAACVSGPLALPDAELASDKEKISVIARNIRNYFRKII